MHDYLTIQLTGMLCLMAVLPWLVSWLVFGGFPFDDAAERRQAMKLFLPAELAVNAVSDLLLICLLWNVKNPFAVMAALSGGSCSYQDVSRLTLALVISGVLAAVYAVAAGFLYFGSWAEFWLSTPGKAALLVVCSLAVIPVTAGAILAQSGKDALEISEVCRRMTVETEDPYTGELEEEDNSYVEVRNTGTLAYEIDRLYLSASIDALQFARVKAVRLAPGESCRLTMAGDAGMDIKKDGGTILYLSNEQGDILDELTLPALKREEIYRKENGRWSVIVPAQEETAVKPPVFSAASGFYDQAFSLTLSAEKNAKIYYTVDGSDPTPESAVYVTPISVYDRSGEPAVYRAIPNTYRNYLEDPSQSSDAPVPRAFVVRAVAVDEAGKQSETVTRTYFIGQTQYENGLTISLVSDPDGLFNRETGICVTGPAYDEWYELERQYLSEGEKIDYSEAPAENYWLHGMEWERPANLEIFSDGETYLQQNVGIRVQGNVHRYLPAQKRFSIYARKQYSGSKTFDKTLFGDYDQSKWLLREGELYAICQRLAAGRDVLTIDYVPVNVFLDGEFWYSQSLYEKFDEDNLANKLGLNADNLLLVKNGEVENLSHAERLKFYDAVQKFIPAHDMSLPESYEAFNELVDIQSYLEMMCFNMYLANMDFSDLRNTVIWCAAFPENDGYGDGRWRWGLLDADLNWDLLNSSFRGTLPHEINPFTMYKKGHEEPLIGCPIFLDLSQNETFRRQYVLTMMDLINTRFLPENTTAVMDGLRVTDSKIRKFFAQRTECFLPMLEEFFELSGQRETVTLTANTPTEAIQLNTISPAVTEDGWSGEYYTDYPITVSVNDPAFFRWEITAGGQTRTSFNRTLEIPVTEGGVEIHAIFK